MELAAAQQDLGAKAHKVGAIDPLKCVNPLQRQLAGIDPLQGLLAGIDPLKGVDPLQGQLAGSKLAAAVGRGGVWAAAAAAAACLPVRNFS